MQNEWRKEMTTLCSRLFVKPVKERKVQGINVHI